MSDKTDTTILLDIYQRLGGIEAKLEGIKGHEGRIVKLERFEGSVSAYIWLGGTIVAGVMFFLGEGLRYLIDKWLLH